MRLFCFHFPPPRRGRISGENLVCCLPSAENLQMKNSIRNSADGERKFREEGARCPLPLLIGRRWGDGGGDYSFLPTVERSRHFAAVAVATMCERKEGAYPSSRGYRRQ